MEINFVQLDPSVKKDGKIILDMLKKFAGLSVTHSAGLSDSVQANLLPALSEHPVTRIYAAFKGKEPVAIAICFLGFSTFAAKPLLNIHDFFVDSNHQGEGIGKAFLDYLHKTAIELNCCKVTLEVYPENLKARGLYRACGFTGDGGHSLLPAGAVFFMSKPC